MSDGRDPRIPHHLLVMGDIGGPATYHAGDEAILAANLLELRRRREDVRFTILSRDPAWSATRFDSDAVPPPSVAPGEAPEDLPARFLALLETNSPSALPPSMAALVEADALVVSGGGNLNSTWPLLLYQRIALIMAAHRLGKPVVVLGQTLGPYLKAQHWEDLVSALSGVAFVGLRELDSMRLALEMGIGVRRTHYQIDDAFFLAPTPLLDSGVDLPAKPWIGVTLAGRLSDRLAVTDALAGLSRSTGAPLVFIPHAAEPDDDAGLVRDLARDLPPDHQVLDILDCQQVVAVTARAAMVISNRYHPLVFASAHGLPSLGLYADDYTRVKLRGALAHDGLEEWTIDAAFAWCGDFRPAADELWQRRAEVGAHLRRRQLLHRVVYDRHWTLVERALAGLPGGSVPHPDVSRYKNSQVPRPVGAWSRRARLLASRADTAMRHERALRIQRHEAARYAASLRATLESREAEIAGLRDLLARLRLDHGQGEAIGSGRTEEGLE